MMITISSLVKCSQWPDTSIDRTQNTVKSHYSWGTQDRFESTRPKRMIPKSVSTSWDGELEE